MANTRKTMADIAGLLEKYEAIPDERFFNEVHNGGEYACVKDVKGSVCIDVGACAGEFASYVYNNFETIYCLEPYSKHYEELVSNIQEFGLYKIKPRRIAIIGDNKINRLEIKCRGGHCIGKDGEEEVVAVTLAEFLRDEKIDHVDLLKIDIEGFEKDVFESHHFKNIYESVPLIVGEHLTGRVHNTLADLCYKLKDSNKGLYKLNG
jgi:FkbM family methyltransferase